MRTSGISTNTDGTVLTFRGEAPSDHDARTREGSPQVSSGTLQGTTAGAHLAGPTWSRRRGPGFEELKTWQIAVSVSTVLPTHTPGPRLCKSKKKVGTNPVTSFSHRMYCVDKPARRFPLQPACRMSQHHACRRPAHAAVSVGSCSHSAAPAETTVQDARLRFPPADASPQLLTHLERRDPTNRGQNHCLPREALRRKTSTFRAV